MVEQAVGGLANRMVGNYRLVERLAAGGVGIVYRAEHLELGIPVAIKVLYPQFSEDGAVLERFRHEARLLFSLRHPHIVEVLDFGRDLEFGYYYVMEYLEGQTLSSLMREHVKGMPDELILDLLEQVCAALDVAHGIGVCHRDINPANIVVLERTDTPHFVKVLDFGIAKVNDIGERMHGTRHGQVFGTPRFMSPEQASGDPDVDHRSDIYSVGVLLYWMLTGHLPYTSTSMLNVLREQLDGTPPSLASKRPTRTFTQALEQLVGDTLSKDRDDRPHSVSLFMERLRRALKPNGKSDAARGTTAVAKAKAPKSDKRGEYVAEGRWVVLKGIGEDEIGARIMAKRVGVEGFAKNVLLRKVHPHLCRDQGIVRSLVADLKDAAKVDHPVLLPLLDVARDGEDLIVAYDRPSGRSLTGLQQDLQAEAWIYICCQLLSALEQMHGEGTIHGEIRADRVYLGSHASVQLADLGLGRMSARLANERRPALRARDDLEAVALLLYEGLTGFPAASERHRREPLPPLGAFLRDVNPELEGVLQTATSLDCTRHFQSAGQFREALLGAVAPATEADLRHALDNVSPDGPTTTTSQTSLTGLHGCVQLSTPVVYVLAAPNGALAHRIEQLNAWPTAQRQYEFRVLADKSDSDKAVERLEQLSVVPHALLVDGLHLAMEHPLVSALRRFPEVWKILVLEQLNGELMQMGVNACGLNGVIVSSFDVPDLLTALQRGDAASVLARRLFDTQKELGRLKRQEQQLATKMAAVAEANGRAVELMAKLEVKNRLIEEKNQFLERLSRKMMQGQERRRRATQQVMSDNEEEVFLRGTLQELSLVDLVQLLAMSNKTAVITLKGGPGPGAGWIAFRRGQLINAEIDDLAGEQAVDALLDWQDGMFTVHGADPALDQVISLGTQELILELMRRKDERANGQAPCQLGGRTDATGDVAI